MTKWEAPEQRVVVPESLRDSLGSDVPPVLRWDVEKHQLVISKHERDLVVIRDLSRYLDGWVYHGKEPRSNNSRVLFQDEDKRWYSVTLGVLQGSFNVETVFGGSERRFLRKRLRELQELVERKGDPRSGR